MNTDHWHVLGAGAIGCLFASYLTQARCPVTLLLRAGSSEKKATVTVEGVGGRTSFECPVSNALQPKHIGHLLVTTKAQDVYTAVLSVAHRLDASSQIVLLANGLGFADKLRVELWEPRYFFGSTTEGAYRLEAGGTRSRHICHAGRGVTVIGRDEEALAPDWFSRWSNAVPDSSWDPAINESMWIKLALNCAINPLCALHRCRNGELTGPELAPQVAALCEEIMQVSTAAGFGAISANLPQRVADVIRATAENRCSMLQDVLAGRSTEIEHITGHLLSVAHRHGTAAPQNEALYRRIINLGR